jgi:hypothetical protein
MTTDERALDRKIDTAGWGLIFLWIGIALLARVGWGVGLVGAGVITLAAQGWRRLRGAKVDRFSLLVGILFATVGVWNVLDVRADLVPLLFIAAGVALLASTWRPPRRRASAGANGGEPSGGAP